MHFLARSVAVLSFYPDSEEKNIMLLPKMIDIEDAGKCPTNEEIQLFLKSLKPGMKLPLPNDYDCPDNYLEQLVAENYLNGLLEGYTLKFITNRSIEYLGDKPCLQINKRFKSIWSTMYDVIKRRELDLSFENNFEDKVGLLLHNYEPASCSCYEDGSIEIGLKINGFKIVCIYHPI